MHCGSWVSKLAWKGYAHIKIEGEGITWTVQHMDFYLKGALKATIVTDHKDYMFR